MNRKLLTPKYALLVELQADFAVPPLTLLGTAELEAIFGNFSATQVHIGSVVSRINHTRANSLPEDLKEIENITSMLSLSEGAGIFVARILDSHFADPSAEKSYAVRSAGLAEDLSSHSFAGLYETHLKVKGISALLLAIRSVWLSAFRKRVIIERLKTGTLSADNPMSVIIQEMISGESAGIAFSIDPRGNAETCIVEEVQGLGESLVSGREAGKQFHFNRDTILAAEASATHERVAQLCLSAEKKLGYPVDVEWAAQGNKIFLLQVRPITTVLRREDISDVPVFQAIHLYGARDDEIGSFGDLPEFARYFRAKRKKIFDFSNALGMRSGAAMLIRANAMGLRSAAAQDILFESFQGPEIVIDLSENVRQLIIPTTDLCPQLALLMPSNPQQVVTFVVRDFIRGKIGVISEFQSSGGVLLEWAREGLLAINRGTAITSSITVDSEITNPMDTPLTADQIELISSATTVAQERMGPVRIEWVADETNVFAIDYSTVAQAPSLTASAGTLSDGFAEAPALFIEATEDLEAMSIAASVSLTNIPGVGELGGLFDRYLPLLETALTKPIVVVNRPYAALAALLPYVSGFVFERASLLCHLAILIREHAIPAVESAHAFELATAARHVRIDTRAAISFSILE